MKRILVPGLIAALILTPALIANSAAQETLAAGTPTYASSVPGTNITLRDNTADEIKAYYSSLNGLSESELQGNNLLKNLKPILQDFTYYSYDAVWKIYEITDREWELSPATADSYNGTSFDVGSNTYTKYSYGSSSKNPGNDPYVRTLYRNRDENGVTLEAARIKEWGSHQQDGTNREHVWCQSRGFKAPSGAEGPAGTDIHHLISGDGYVNQATHNNTPYGFVNPKAVEIDSKNKQSWLSGNLKGTPTVSHDGDIAATVFEPQDSDKGDIARALFYMAACYNNISGKETISQYNPNLALADFATSDGNSEDSSAKHVVTMGTLSDLLSWHKMDPVDEYEIHRNNLIYNNYQHNRNPFIDYPEWVDYIWGTTVYNADIHRTLAYNSSPTGHVDLSKDVINGYQEPEPTADLASIAVENVTQKYFVGETYRFEGKVVATYSDDSTKDVTADITVSTVDLSSAGNKNVTVTYKGKNAQFAIEAVVADRIEVVSPKTDYNQGDAYTTPTVYAYSGEYRRDVSKDCAFSGYDQSKSGEQTVTVSFGATQQSYKVTVKSSSFIDNLPLPLWAIILIGVGVLILVVLFLVFASKKTKKKAVKAVKKAAKSSSKKSSSSSGKKKK